MSGSFKKTIGEAIEHAVSRYRDDANRKGWFICYMVADQTYFCLSLSALSAWTRLDGWVILGVLRPTGAFKLRRGWAQKVILARLTA